MGAKSLRRIQLGREADTAPGTAVAATTRWRGMGVLNDDRRIVHVDEEVGIALPTTRAYVDRLGCTVNFDPVEATFPQLPYIFEAGVNEETPTQDGAGSDYIYAYSFPTTTLNDPATYTLEMGDDQLVQETDHAFVQSFRIRGNAGEGIFVESVWRGRDVVDSSFTSVNIPTLVAGDHMVFGGSTFSLDAVTDDYGDTAISSTLLGFELDVRTGLVPVWTNLAKDFDYMMFDRSQFAARLRLTYRHNATTDGQRDLYEAATPRLVQLLFPGPAVGTPGTTYSNKTFIINAPGIYTSFPRADGDGNSTVQAEMQIGYDLTDATALNFIVVNELSSLT